MEELDDFVSTLLEEHGEEITDTMFRPNRIFDPLGYKQYWQEMADKYERIEPLSDDELEAFDDFAEALGMDEARRDSYTV